MACPTTRMTSLSRALSPLKCFTRSIRSEKKSCVYISSSLSLSLSNPYLSAPLSLTLHLSLFLPFLYPPSPHLSLPLFLSLSSLSLYLHLHHAGHLPPHGHRGPVWEPDQDRHASRRQVYRGHRLFKLILKTLVKNIIFHYWKTLKIPQVPGFGLLALLKDRV